MDAAGRKVLLPSICTTRAGPAMASDVDADHEPVSPTARLMDGFYIVVTVGLGTPVNLPVFRDGIKAGIARYPRFRRIQVLDASGKPWWVPVEVDVDDHIVVVPRMDVDVEDYVASLSTAPMDRARPLWEFHLIDVPTCEAASTVVIRVHHSLGDGMSLLAILMASTRSVANPERLPAIPPPPKRTGAIYARPAAVAWAWFYYAVLAWNTAVDVALFVATIVFLRDPRTLFKRADPSSWTHSRRRRKRFVHRSLSLDDVKFLKNDMNCTVNDILVGVTSAALSRYYFRKSGDSNTKELRLRSILLVNMRPPTSLQTCADMIASGKSVDGTLHGNQLGYIILPFHIAKHDDPLEYVRKAKKILDRKKSSLEAIFTHLVAEITTKILGVKAAGVIFHRMISHTTISFSNMIGPTEMVQLFGHPVAFYAPSVYGPPEALTVHYQSYGSTIKVILAVDEEHFPDHSQLLNDFTDSLALIKHTALTQQLTAAATTLRYK